MGIYHVILTWYQSQVKGCLHFLSIFEVSVTACNEYSHDLLFLTIFRSRELLHCVWSDISSEEPLLFRMKRFPVSLATVILQLQRYTFFFFAVIDLYPLVLF